MELSGDALGNGVRPAVECCCVERKRSTPIKMNELKWL